MFGETASRHHHFHPDRGAEIAPRRDGSERQTLEGILAACDRWISDRTTPTLSHADRETVLDTLLLAVLPDLPPSRIPSERARQPLDPRGSQPEERADEDFDRELWIEAVHEIEHSMFLAWLSIPEKDRDLLDEAYALGPVAGPSQPSRIRPFPDERARRAALYRARQRFSIHLESLLVKALKAQPQERRPLEAALHIVQGKAVAKATAVTQERTRER